MTTATATVGSAQQYHQPVSIKNNSNNKSMSLPKHRGSTSKNKNTTATATAIPVVSVSQKKHGRGTFPSEKFGHGEEQVLVQSPAVVADTMSTKTPAEIVTGNKKERREFPHEKFGHAIPIVQVSTTAAAGSNDNLQNKNDHADSNSDTNIEERQESPPQKLSLQDLFCNPVYRLYIIGLMLCCFVILVAVILVVTILVTQSSDTSDDNDIVPPTIYDGVPESPSSSSLSPTPSSIATGIEEADALLSLSPTVTESPTSVPSSTETRLPTSTASPTSSPCTLCFQGESPISPENGIAGPGTDSCMDTITVLSGSHFTSSDDVCLGFNAQAYWACGCPTLPPPREEHLCSMCGDGSLPTNPDTLIDYGAGYPVWENLTCEAQAIRLTYAQVGSNWIPFQTCEGFQNAFGEICGC